MTAGLSGQSFSGFAAAELGDHGWRRPIYAATLEFPAFTTIADYFSTIVTGGAFVTPEKVGVAHLKPTKPE